MFEMAEAYDVPANDLITQLLKAQYVAFKENYNEELAAAIRQKEQLLEEITRQQEELKNEQLRLKNQYKQVSNLKAGLKLSL
jgi:predicted transport protein